MELALSKDKGIQDPIIIEPQGYTAEQGWEWCHGYVESCGGIAYPDGEANLRAAAGADPGCCSCPNCHQYFWAFGRIIQCTGCGFQFQTDWWPMYSYGVGDYKTLHGNSGIMDAEIKQRIIHGISERMPERIKHPYYRYGFEHPVPEGSSAREQHDKLPWKEIMEQSR